MHIRSMELDYDPNRKRDWYELIVYVISLVMLFFMLSGCKTIEYVPIKEIVYKDSVVLKKEYDSIEIKVKEYIKQDTIYRDSMVFHYILRTDTIYKNSRDSIPYPVEVVKEVERSLNGYEKTMIRLGWALIVLLVAIVGWKVVKWYIKIKG